VSQWAILCVRLLCSLPSLVICTVVSQVAVLPSYNSMATVSLQIVCQVALLLSFTGNLHCYKSGHSAPFLQQWGHSQLALLTACSNFILICPNLFEFILNLSEFCRVFEWKERVWERLGTWFISAIFPHRSRIHTRQGFHPGLRPGLWSLCYSQSTIFSFYNSLWNSR